jgi:poly-gamma-glutamate capsule biosynthesis protein CapA/YwtB (metallophosphatase superfamily)
MELLIAGDLVPTKSNIELFANGDINRLLGEELYNIWYSSDLRIFNLEAPISNISAPIDKCGPNLSIPINSITGIKELKPSLISLANNHIFDQGEGGLSSTIDLLREASIPTVGAGDNIDSASDSIILNKKGKKVGIYACVEHEFGVADSNNPGANPFDPLESFDHVQKLRIDGKCDYIIVLFHGGYENYRYPSPHLRKVCKKFVERGADLVVVQHSHCIGTFEEYKNSTIVYGQGNFIFDYSDNELWETSLLIKVTFNSSMKVEYIPCS